MELGALRIVDVYLSQDIVNELTGVLSRKFRLSKADVERNIAHILRWSTIVEPTSPVTLISRNPPDDRILECCLEADADFLVTGDKRDLLPLGHFGGTSIVTAAEFLNAFSGSTPI